MEKQIKPVILTKRHPSLAGSLEVPEPLTHNRGDKCLPESRPRTETKMWTRAYQYGESAYGNNVCFVGTC